MSEITKKPSRTPERRRIIRFTAQEQAKQAPKLASALLENNFSEAPSSNRRAIFVDPADISDQDVSAFSKGYVPTQAELYDDKYGSDNWGVVPTGNEVDRPALRNDEHPETTDWMNEELLVFVRDGDQLTARTFEEITVDVKVQEALASLAILSRS